MPKVLFLFNKIHSPEEIARIERGELHDNQLFGLLRLRKHGFSTHYLELEQYLPGKVATFLRRNVFTMHFAHLPLFPLFFKYDIVFTSTAYGSLFLWALWPFRKPKWVVLDFNTSGTIGKRETLKQKLFYFAISRVSGIVPISLAEEKTLKEMFPRLATRIRFIHEGTDTTFFAPVDGVEEPRRVLSAGMFAERDFETLIEATKDLGVTTVLATKKSIASALGALPPHVEIVERKPEEMPLEYARASIVYVGVKLSSQNPNDSIGTFSLIEPMSTGKALLVTETASMRSYVAPGSTGIFVPPKSPALLCRALLELLNDEGARKKLGDQARAFVVTKCDSEVFASELASFFADLEANG